MRLKLIVGRLTIVLAVLGSLCPVTRAQAQSAPTEKPELKDFGSSLKRLKWDPKTRSAVDTRPEKKQGASSTEEDVVRVETVLAVCDVLVVDRKQDRVISGLTKDDFVITENDAPQTVAMFSRGDDVTRPRSIVLVIDYSASQLPYINTSIDAARTLVDKLGPLDKMAIVTDDVSLLVDFTRDRKKLKEKLETLKARANSGDLGKSFQFSALLATLKELISNEERSIVIFQTDGDELPQLQPTFPSVVGSNRRTPRTFGLADIFKAAQKARPTIYSIIPSLRVMGLSESEQTSRARTIYEKRNFHVEAVRPELASGVGAAMTNQSMTVAFYAAYARELNLEQSAMAEVALKSGGWAEYLEEPGQAADTYARILSDINHRYVIGYYPTNKEHDGKLRRVHISVRNHPEYAVVGRQSYYAPEGNN